MLTFWSVQTIIGLWGLVTPSEELKGQQFFTLNWDGYSQALSLAEIQEVSKGAIL